MWNTKAIRKLRGSFFGQVGRVRCVADNGSTCPVFLLRFQNITEKDDGKVGMGNSSGPASAEFSGEAIAVVSAPLG